MACRSGTTRASAAGDPAKHLIPDEGMQAFMRDCARTLGAEYFRTPRDAVKGFVGLLSLLEQNPGTDWKGLLSRVKVEQTPDPEAGPPARSAKPDEDDLASFKL